MRLLLVEDSLRLQSSIAQGLREAGYAVDVVGDGKQGLIHGLTTEYDVIILDLMLPTMHGLEVLRSLRERDVQSSVLILTAMDSIDDRVRGLRGGADDYLVKPFSFAELLARVQAMTRRRHGVRNTVVRIGPLLIDSAARTVQVVRSTGSESNAPLELSPREYSILEYLAHRVGCAVTRSELEEHLYDEQSQVMSNAVDVAISSLRGKLERAGCPQLIHTRRKVGYVLQAAPVGEGVAAPDALTPLNTQAARRGRRSRGGVAEQDQ